MKKALILFVSLLLISFALNPVVVPTIYCGPYTTSGAITLIGVSNQTIEAKSFNGGSFHIRLTNCHNITIKHIKSTNCTNRAIWLDNGCTDITVDSSYFEGNWTTMYILNATSNIKFLHNAIKNQVANNNFTSQVIQFNNSSGPGFEAAYNNIDIDFGAGTNPNPGLGDSFSLYKSNGTSASPLWVHHNIIRGGGTGVLGNGMAGIVAGDVGGSWQLVENNILVNTGYVGIQVQGGHDIIVRNNQITSANLPWAALGLGSANFSGLPVYNNEISHNTVNWIFGFSAASVKPHRDTAWKSPANPKPIGWSTNIVYPASSSLGPSILPAFLWVSCSIPVISYTSPVTYTVGTAITPNTPTNTGGSVISYSISPALSSGLSFNSSTGSITGTPTSVRGATNYSVIALGASGNDTTSVNITVRVNKPHISYSPTTNVYIYGQLASLSPTNTGGAATSFSVSPSIPTGLIFNTTTGVISGRPSVISSIRSYLVTAYNGTGTDTLSLKITVNKAPLTIKANDQSKVFGSVNPSLTIAYSGFAFAESQSNLITQPTAHTTATQFSPVTTYPITPSGAVATNYTFVYQNGVLTISPVGNTIRIRHRIKY